MERENNNENSYLLQKGAELGTTNLKNKNNLTKSSKTEGTRTYYPKFSAQNTPVGAGSGLMGE